MYEFRFGLIIYKGKKEEISILFNKVYKYIYCKYNFIFQAFKNILDIFMDCDS
jgi:hypothetical protein